mgnify:CR=1 FL=1
MDIIPKNGNRISISAPVLHPTQGFKLTNTEVKDEINNRLYVAAKDLKSNELILMEFADGELTRIDTNGLKLKPVNIIEPRNRY